MLSASNQVEMQICNEVSQDSNDFAESTERLRQILSSQQQRDVGYDEAQEVGATLIEFFEILAEEEQDEPEA